MAREHKQEVDELHKDLQEKDEKMEHLIDDYEEQLAVSLLFYVQLIQYTY